MTNIPIWVTDPASNNNPYLKIVGTIFIASEGASENAMGFTGGPKMFWSTDGLTWNSANFNNGYSGMQLFGGSLSYANKSWMIKYSDNANSDLGVYYLSNDGKNWSLVFKETSMQFDGTFSFNTATNQWKIVLTNGGVGSPQTLFFNITASPNPSFTVDDAPGLLADASQTAVSNQNNIAHNPLPPGWTAMRFGTGIGPNNFAFQYTQTPITTAIINSGSNWPGATWVTTFTFDNSGAGQADASNNSIDFALPN